MKNLRNAKIAFDIDNVVVDFAKLFRKVLKEEYGIPYEESKNTYYTYIPGFKDKDYKCLIDSLLIDRCDELEVFCSARRALYNFYIVNGPISFITARSEDVKESTIKYLKENIPGIQFKVMFCKDHQKENLLKEFDYFVDDQINNLIPAVDSGIIKKGFLINQDWNVNSGKFKDIIRVHTLLDVWDWFF